MTLIAFALMLGTPAFAETGDDPTDSDSGVVVDVEDCTNGEDDDGDDDVDCDDSDCSEDEACAGSGTEDCTNGEDDDGDDDVDCADDDCSAEESCEETETSCEDEFDNDGDGDVDCDDSDCSGSEDVECEEASGSGAATLAGELGGCGCSASPTPKLAGVSVFLLLGSLLFARRRRIAPSR